MPGISASPDEANARYFHVMIAGPDVSLHSHLRSIILLSLGLSFRWWRLQAGAFPAGGVPHGCS